MTAALLHIAYIYAAVAVLTTIAILLVKAGGDHDTDAEIAEDQRRTEHERQQQRAQIAKCRIAEAEARIRALGHHGGAEFQQAEYAEACGWVPARAWDTAADLTALDEVETPADMFGGEGA